MTKVFILCKTLNVWTWRYVNLTSRCHVSGYLVSNSWLNFLRTNALAEQSDMRDTVVLNSRRKDIDGFYNLSKDQLEDFVDKTWRLAMSNDWERLDRFYQSSPFFPDAKRCRKIKKFNIHSFSATFSVKLYAKVKWYLRWVLCRVCTNIEEMNCLFIFTKTQLMKIGCNYNTLWCGRPIISK